MKLYVKRTFSFLCVSLLIVILLNIFKYILVDDTKSYTRIMIHEMYNSEQNIDVLFVGSSHCYRSIIPSIMDNNINKYTFNLGTSSQDMDGSLALIKETLKYHDVSEIYLEMYYSIALSEAYLEREQLTKTYIISDYMRPSLNKLEYLLEASSREHYPNSFIVARRNWDKIFDINYIFNLINQKSQDSYINYRWIRNENDIEYYEERGFVANISSLESMVSWNNSAWDSIETNYISQDWENSLYEIIDLCEKNGITLVLFTAPMPASTIIGKTNYDEYINYVRNIATQHNIKYYDFNLCKDSYFSTINNEYFMDNSHLNLAGAEAFSEIFSSLIVGNVSEDDLFHNSLSEKILMQTPMVLGVALPSPIDTNPLQGRIISNRESGIQYRITLKLSNGNSFILQDYSENSYFSLPTESHGTLVIEWQCPSENITNTQSIYLTY